jgi:DNA-binding CsgD family transcriptional regulator
VTTDTTQPQKSRLGEPLRSVELDVLKCYARGLENEGVATELHMSFHTVKTHSRRAFEKLGVQNRTEAVVAAIAGGLIELPPVAGPPARLKAEPKAAPKPDGPPMLEIPAAVYAELLAVVAGVVRPSVPLPVLRQSAERALHRARAHVRDGRSTAGRAA